MGIDPVPTGSDGLQIHGGHVYTFCTNMTHITSLQLGTCM